MAGRREMARIDNGEVGPPQPEHRSARDAGPIRADIAKSSAAALSCRGA
jgi:hypothetical protein